MNKSMYALVSFFLLMGPRPANMVLFNNKFFVALAPLLCLSTLLWLFSKEITSRSFEHSLRDKEQRNHFYQCLRFTIFAQAISTVVFGASEGAYDFLISSYMIMPIYAVFAAPIAEEIVYRRIIFRFLDKKTNFWFAASLSSIIFALGHFSPNRFVGYFLTGMIFCYFYKKSGNLVTTIMAHCSINFISILVATLRS